MRGRLPSPRRLRRVAVALDERAMRQTVAEVAAMRDVDEAALLAKVRQEVAAAKAAGLPLLTYTARQHGMTEAELLADTERLLAREGGA